MAPSRHFFAFFRAYGPPQKCKKLAAGCAKTNPKSAKELRLDEEEARRRQRETEEATRMRRGGDEEATRRPHAATAPVTIILPYRNLGLSCRNLGLSKE